MKARFQHQEKVQGNDLIASLVGKNFDRRHKQFKRYFAIQHPYLPVPPQKTHPNWKVDPFLQHFKKTGDGFQVDTLCSNGYTFTFYFRHQPAPKKYIDEGYAHLHARVRFMFDQLKSKHHSVFMV
jgi:hypothetical protein